MGKTPTALRLRIAVWGPWLARPEVVALREKGHDVYETTDVLDGGPPDLILHPAAHAWGDWAWEKPAYLAAALKRCRDRKRVAK